MARHGLIEPTEVQKQAIPAALAGKSLVVSSETGSGKSAAFLIPLIQRLLDDDAPKSGTRALIISPTRELTKQLLRHCKELISSTHLKVDSITGGAEFKYQKAVFRKNPHIIIATPGRLKEHADKGSCDFKDLEVLVLDEADRMMEMGLFEDIIDINSYCNPEKQTLLFSATIDEKLQSKGINRLLNEHESILLSKPKQLNEAITQQYILANNEEFKQLLLEKLLATETYKKALIFTNTKKLCHRLCSLMQYKKYNATSLHGDISQDTRYESINQFRSGRMTIMVATDVAARGLDVDGIDLVINFDIPRSAEDFIHRSGRTGRAGETGLCVSLVVPNEWNLLTSIEHQVQTDFTERKLAGLKTKFKKPHKAKTDKKDDKAKSSNSSSEQARKSFSFTNKVEEKKKKSDKPKKRLRDQKNVGKRRAASENPDADKHAQQKAEKSAQWGDGFAPAAVKKKAPPQE
jgi:superfamily II DNA/RNA helicase